MLPDLAYFPEEKYPPYGCTTDYWRQVKAGYACMAESSVVICGLARDVSYVLSQTIARIERLGALFQDYRVLIYENDSADETPTMLRLWSKKNGRVTAVSEQLKMPTNPGTRCLDRAGRMAVIRNKCLRMIRDQFSAIPYTILLDTDLLNGWSYHGIAHTFGMDRLWDVVGSSGFLTVYKPNKAPYVVQFDAWAYRTLGRTEPHSAKEVNPLLYERGDPPIEMESCFGGLGVYRTETMLRSEYAGGDCEHVPFHLGIRRIGGRIWLNPSQITDYGVRHW